MTYVEPQSRQEKKKNYLKAWKDANRDAYRESQREWRGKNKDKVSATDARAYKKHRITKLLAAARNRAKKTGLEFNIIKADLHVPETCPILGTPLRMDAAPLSPEAPSLDRVDNTKGYVRGNVRVISSRANRLKSDNTRGTLLSILSYLEKAQS